MKRYLQGGVDADGGRICHDCHTWKPLAEYRLDSRGYVRNQCKACQQAYATVRQRIARSRRRRFMTDKQPKPKPLEVTIKPARVVPPRTVKLWTVAQKEKHQ